MILPKWSVGRNSLSFSCGSVMLTDESSALSMDSSAVVVSIGESTAVDGIRADPHATDTLPRAASHFIITLC